MDILVCIKQVPASNKVEVDPVTGVLLRNGADSKMNPYDLYALETALKIREEVGGTISVISMGPPQAMAVIREAFAMGVDRGRRYRTGWFRSIRMVKYPKCIKCKEDIKGRIRCDHDRDGSAGRTRDRQSSVSMSVIRR